MQYLSFIRLKKTSLDLVLCVRRVGLFRQESLPHSMVALLYAHGSKWARTLPSATLIRTSAILLVIALRQLLTSDSAAFEVVVRELHHRERAFDALRK